MQCGLWGSLFGTALQEGRYVEEAMPLPLITFLQNSDVAQFCPCNDEMVNEFDFDGETIRNTLVCGSYGDWALEAYYEYCRNILDASMTDELYEETVFDVAYDELLKTLRELDNNSVLTVDEIRLESERAYDVFLKDSAVCGQRMCRFNYCIEGCALFVRDACCQDFPRPTPM